LKIPDAAWQVLACPHCGAGVSPTSEGARCSDCDKRFPGSHGKPLDLRLTAPKKFTVEFELGTPLLAQGFEFACVDGNPDPQVDFSSKSTPWKLPPNLLSHFPKAQSTASLALDLGCGDGLHRAACEQAGFQWIGLDFSDEQALIRGDAHALPLKNGSIEFVLSIAVLEHIQFPFVVAREVLRVLKPGGLYIGTVAFLEPFHGNSFYHHTHLATYNTLRSAGFIVEQVGPNRTWSGLRAQASMSGLFPKMPAAVSRAVVFPLELLHKLWWRLGAIVNPKANEITRLLTNTGALEFIAHKPL
jgi:SAM-dependent methyltransferase